VADNVTLDPGTGGSVVRTKDRTAVETQIVALDINPSGSEVLQAAAALADTTSNPTTAPWAGMLMCFNGTTWDRVRGDTTNGLFANVKTSALPTGAATSAKQPALGTAGSASADVISVQGVASMTALKVDGSGVTQPVSAASLPLPSGASTSAKQPALGTAGSASADVLSVQGVASMTALKVDGSAVTQPVSLAGTQSVNQAQVAGTTTDTNSGVKSAGTQRVVLATDQPQLTNALKVDGSAVTQPVSVAAVVHVDDNSGSLTVDAPVGTPVFSTPTPSTTGGWSKITALAQTTTKKAVKASAGTFGGYYAFNPNTAATYIQVFDVASASVTLGSTAPDMVFCIPGNASGGAAANLEFTNGVNMATAITLACTTTATGSTAPSTGLDLTLFFK
jgi:hypothetical protein